MKKGNMKEKKLSGDLSGTIINPENRDEQIVRRLLGMLGLAKRAGRLICGTDVICGEIRNCAEHDGRSENVKNKNAVRVVLVASDASQNTVKRIVNCCGNYGVSCISIPAAMDELANAIGKNRRSVADAKGMTAAVGITDEGFKGAVEKIMNEYSAKVNLQSEKNRSEL